MQSLNRRRASIMMTASEMVSRVTPPMKAPAPIKANAPGSTQDQGLGGRNTPGGALRAKPGNACYQSQTLMAMLPPSVCTARLAGHRRGMRGSP